MDPDSFAVAVCRGEDQPAGFAGTNPQNDKCCHGGLPVGGGRPVGCIALLTGVAGDDISGHFAAWVMGSGLIRLKTSDHQELTTTTMFLGVKPGATQPHPILLI